MFSARLRLPASVSDAEAAAYADTVLDLVELTPQRNALVGVGAGGGADAGLSLEQVRWGLRWQEGWAWEGGLPGGAGREWGLEQNHRRATAPGPDAPPPATPQRKRLSIAVELVANPAVSQPFCCIALVHLQCSARGGVPTVSASSSAQLPALF